MQLHTFLLYLLFLLLSLLPTRASSSVLNSSPVIGVVTIPSDTPAYRDPKLYSQIESNYAQYLESAGARVIPIQWDLPLDNLTDLFHKVNGILFTGGGTKLWDTINGPQQTQYRIFSNFTNQTRHLLNLAEAAFLKNDYFPIWGTCQGLELLAIDITDDPHVLSDNDQIGLGGKIRPSPAAYYLNFFSHFHKDLVDYMAQSEEVWFYHGYGFHPDTFNSYDVFRENFEILAVGNDTRDVPFVAAFEGKKIPMYATQFHPERTCFDWFDSPTIPHTPEAIMISQHLANFFVKEARKNAHKFEDEQELRKRLIWNVPVENVPNDVPTHFFENYNVSGKDSGFRGF